MGTALGGAAALLGVMFGWLDFRAWRRQKRDEPRSDAAIRTFELMTSACDALERLAVPVAVGIPATDADREAVAKRLREIHDERYQRVTGDLRALDEASSIATLLLDSRHDFILNRLSAVRQTITVSYMLCAIHVEDGDERQAEDAARDAWGPQVQERIRDIRRAARDALEPVVQYQGSPLLSTTLAVQRRRLWSWIRNRDAR